MKEAQDNIWHELKCPYFLPQNHQFKKKNLKLWTDFWLLAIENNIQSEKLMRFKNSSCSQSIDYKKHYKFMNSKRE